MYAPKGRHRRLNPIPHLSFLKMGGHSSFPISWARRAVICTQGEALRIEANISSPISQAGRLPFISYFMGGKDHRIHPRGGTGTEPNTSSPISRPGRPHPTSHISHYVGFLCIKGKILIRGLIFSYTPLLSYTLLLHVCNRTGTH